VDTNLIGCVAMETNSAATLIVSTAFPGQTNAVRLVGEAVLTAIAPPMHAGVASIAVALNAALRAHLAVAVPSLNGVARARGVETPTP